MKILTSVVFIILLIVNFSSYVLALDSSRSIHIFVALCDNEHQGIIPVKPVLGNGEDPRNNLYWGALYGVKTFFKRSEKWQLLSTIENPTSEIIERCIFKHRNNSVYLVADAYRGREIKKSIDDFFQAASGNSKDSVSVEDKSESVTIEIGGNSDLIAYVGHDGLMDFDLNNYPNQNDNNLRRVIVLACASRQYFCAPLQGTGAKSLLLTTGLMAPEAYTLETTIEGWISNEGDEEIRLGAARAYNKYQKCSLIAAKKLFVTSCTD